MPDLTKFTKLRAVLNETAAGYFSDTNLYYFLDNAQNLIIELLLQKQRALKLARGRFEEVEALKSLLTQASAITISSNSNSISLSSITNMIEMYSAEIYNHTDNVPMILSYIPLYELRRRIANTYTGHIYDAGTKQGDVFCSYYNGSLLTSFTNGTFPYAYYDRLLIYYYKQPTAVTSSQDFTLPTNCNEAGIEFALYYAYIEDHNEQRAEQHYNKGLQLISNL